jgi:hypothetical protein
MRAKQQMVLSLVAAGALAALLWLTLGGLPYGRLDFEAFADLYPPAECPSGSECVSLVAGCQIVTATENLDTAALRASFNPEYDSAWLLDPATGTWTGDSPAAGAAMTGPNDLPGVDRLDGFFACIPEGGSTFTRAAI